MSNLRIQAFFSKVIFVCLWAFSSLSAFSQTWVPFTGGNSPGEGGTLRTWFFSNQDNTLWASMGLGGLHKSSDFGATWTPSNFGIDGRNLAGLTIDYSSSPAKIFVASRQYGIYASSNGGASFQKTASTGLSNFYFAGIRIIGNRMFVFMRDCPFGCGIYYSDDQASTWTKAVGLPDSAWVNGLTWTDSGLFAASSEGVYKSSDNGANWSYVNIPGPGKAVSTPGGNQGPYVNTINFSNIGSTPVYLAGFLNGGVYKSTDGVNWSARNSGLPANASAWGASCQWAATTSAFTCYATLDGAGIYKSTDNAETWQIMSSVNAAQGHITFNTNNNTTYYYQFSRAGIYNVTNNGSSFSKGLGQPLGVITNVDFDTNGVAYAYATDGVYKSVNNSWALIPGLPATQIGNGGNVLVRGLKVLAGTDHKGVYKLNSSSATPAWEPMNSGLPSVLVNTSAQLRSNDSLNDSYYLSLYGAGFYFWDGTSNTWVARNTGLSGRALFVRSMQAKGALIMLSTEAGLYISKDSGLTWTLSGLKDNANNVLRADQVAIDPNSTSVMYAAVMNLGAYGATSASNGLWKSSDGGATWSQNQFFKSVKMKEVSALNRGGGTLLTVSTWDETEQVNGVYFSADAGATWSRYQQGLQTSYLGHVDASPDGTNIFLSTRLGLYAMSPGADLNLKVISGWNLLGNSWSQPVSVSALLGDASKVKTVWKWDASRSSWAFYAPSLPDGGASYAAQKGYQTLTTINPGEGFWLNAVTAFNFAMPMGGIPINCGSFSSLPSGWSLISTGDNKYARAFNNCLGITPPAAERVASNELISLWAWNATLSQWYFYAPALDNNATLSSYATGKNYLDFGSTTLTPGSGFWVNRP